MIEGSSKVRSWLRCYRCWSQIFELLVHYDGIHRIDADTGERGEVVEEMQEAVVQCMDSMHDQPHLAFPTGGSSRSRTARRGDRRRAVGRVVHRDGDTDNVETCSAPTPRRLTDASFGEHGTLEFFTHVRFHKHDEAQIVIHLLVELYARSAEEATDVLQEAARGTLTITSLAEESRPQASTDGGQPATLPTPGVELFVVVAVPARAQPIRPAWTIAPARCA